MPREPVLEQDLIWLRPPRARRGPRPTLSREQITRAAIELADQEGVEAVSMRRIAAKLGAGATSLYWYVSSKDDLYELMVDEVIGEIPFPAVSGDWRIDLRTLAENTLQVLRRHRWLVVLGIQPGLGPKTQGYGRAALAVFEGLEVGLAAQVNILATLNNYLFGFLHRENAWEELRRRSGLTANQWSGRLRRYLEQTSDQDEGLAAHVAARLQLVSDDSFHFGLECLLDGIAQQLNR